MPTPQEQPSGAFTKHFLHYPDRGLGASYYLNSNSELCNWTDSGRLALVSDAPEGILSISQRDVVHLIFPGP